MTAGRYAVGYAALVVVCASMVVAAVSLRARLLPDWSGALARLAESVLGLAVLIAILEVLGAVGLFRLAPIVVACVIAAAAARAARGSTRAASSPQGSRRSRLPVISQGSRLSRLPVTVALIAAAAVIAEWAVPTLVSYDVGIRSFDSLWYHLPWAASFAQTGWVTTLRFTDVEYLTAFYPATAELVHGLGIVLLGRDTLSPAINLGWLSLTLLAAWCIGAPRGLGPATMTGAALALATPMMRISQGGTAANDIAGVCFLLAAVALVVNALAREADQGDPAAADSPRAVPLVLAAIAAGLAISVKLSLLAPVLALTVGTIVIAQKGHRARAAKAWIPAAAIAACYWYLRNLIAVGNPLPWVSLGGILPTPAAPLQQQTGYAIVHYATDTGIWSRFFGPGLASGLGPWWVAVAVVAVLGPTLCLLGLSTRLAPRVRRRRTRKGGGAADPPRTRQGGGAADSPAALPMLGLVALASLAAYLITPETAAGPAGDPSGFAFNLRYAAPGLTLALAVTPLAPWLEHPRARAATQVIITLLLAVTLAEDRLWSNGYLAGAVLVGAAALAVLAAGIASARRPPAAVVLSGVAIAAIALAGYAGQRHYLRGRYTLERGSSSLSPLWAWARGVHDAHIGLVGTFGGFFAYPLFGLDDSNRVHYIAQHGPHGSFTPIRSCRVWRAAVNAGHYRYLVTTPARNPWHPHSLQYSPEGSWTGSDPAAHLIMRLTAHRQPISLYELTGPLEPSGCPV